MLGSVALAVTCLSVLAALFAGLAYRGFWETRWGPSAYRTAVSVSGVCLVLGFGLLIASQHA